MRPVTEPFVTGANEVANREIAIVKSLIETRRRAPGTGGPDEAIEVGRGFLLSLIVDGRSMDDQLAADLASLHLVTVGAPGHPRGAPFLVARFGDGYWVIPRATRGLDRFLQAVTLELERPGATVLVRLLRMPFAWRRLAFGTLPLVPAPRLTAYRPGAWPRWREERPCPPSDLLDRI